MQTNKEKTVSLPFPKRALSELRAEDAALRCADVRCSEWTAEMHGFVRDIVDRAGHEQLAEIPSKNCACTAGAVYVAHILRHGVFAIGSPKFCFRQSDGLAVGQTPSLLGCTDYAMRFSRLAQNLVLVVSSTYKDFRAWTSIVAKWLLKMLQRTDGARDAPHRYLLDGCATGAEAVTAAVEQLARRSYANIFAEFLAENEILDRSEIQGTIDMMPFHLVLVGADTDVFYVSFSGPEDLQRKQADFLPAQSYLSPIDSFAASRGDEEMASTFYALPAEYKVHNRRLQKRVNTADLYEVSDTDKNMRRYNAAAEENAFFFLQDACQCAEDVVAAMTDLFDTARTMMKGVLSVSEYAHCVVFSEHAGRLAWKEYIYRTDARPNRREILARYTDAHTGAVDEAFPENVEDFVRDRMDREKVAKMREAFSHALDSTNVSALSSATEEDYVPAGADTCARLETLPGILRAALFRFVTPHALLTGYRVALLDVDKKKDTEDLA